MNQAKPRLPDYVMTGEPFTNSAVRAVRQTSRRPWRSHERVSTVFRTDADVVARSPLAVTAIPADSRTVKRVTFQFRARQDSIGNENLLDENTRIYARVRECPSERVTLRVCPIPSNPNSSDPMQFCEVCFNDAASFRNWFC